MLEKHWVSTLIGLISLVRGKIYPYYIYVVKTNWIREYVNPLKGQDYSKGRMKYIKGEKFNVSRESVVSTL